MLPIHTLHRQFLMEIAAGKYLVCLLKYGRALSSWRVLAFILLREMTIISLPPLAEISHFPY